MRIVLLTILMLTSWPLKGQNGYIKFSKDSVVYGYLRPYTSFLDGHKGIELWKEKRDSNPLKIKKSDIFEYAIRKDTIRIFKSFTPFADEKVHFEMVEAELVSGSKVNLFVIRNYANPDRISNYTGGGLIPALIDESMGNYTYMYILEDPAIDYVRALPGKTERLKDALMDFFPERYLIRYAQEKGEITYRKIPALVKLYNSK
jgi:hypothetical protein